MAKDETILIQEKQISDQDEELQNKDEEIQTVRQDLQARDQELHTKEQEISALKQQTSGVVVMEMGGSKTDAEIAALETELEEMQKRYDEVNSVLATTRNAELVSGKCVFHLLQG